MIKQIINRIGVAAVALALILPFVLTSTSDAGSSSGRAIAAVADPTPPQTATDIYHINDDDYLWGLTGHSAVIIPRSGGCTYYSFSPPNILTTFDYNNSDDAKRAAKMAKYDREQHWACDGNQADAGRGAAESYAGTPWYAFTRNCWHMVYAALNAAGTNAEDSTWVPNLSYERNVGKPGCSSNPL
jgi:hypothetical protein